MAWEGAATTETGIGEAAATTWFALLPKETAHVQVTRTDGATTDDIIVSVYASVDNGTTIDKSPLRQFRVAPSTPAPVFSFTVTGVRYFRVQNDSLAGGDATALTVSVLRDGGLVVP